MKSLPPLINVKRYACILILLVSASSCLCAKPDSHDLHQEDACIKLFMFCNYNLTFSNPLRVLIYVDDSQELNMHVLEYDLFPDGERIRGGVRIKDGVIQNEIPLTSDPDTPVIVLSGIDPEKAMVFKERVRNFIKYLKAKPRHLNGTNYGILLFEDCDSGIQNKSSNACYLNADIYDAEYVYSALESIINVYRVAILPVYARENGADASVFNALKDKLEKTVVESSQIIGQRFSDSYLMIRFRLIKEYHQSYMNELSSEDFQSKEEYKRVIRLETRATQKDYHDDLVNEILSIPEFQLDYDMPEWRDIHPDPPPVEPKGDEPTGSE